MSTADLPPRHSLQSALGSVQFAACFIAHVFGSHQHTLQKMSARDWYCCMFFDEISVREYVSFYQKLECIECFDNYGTEITCSIANYVLLFMVRGLHSKWRQPAVYY